jgi:hypothetical protein
MPGHLPGPQSVLFESTSLPAGRGGGGGPAWAAPASCASVSPAPGPGQAAAGRVRRRVGFGSVRLGSWRRRMPAGGQGPGSEVTKFRALKSRSPRAGESHPGTRPGPGTRTEVGPKGNVTEMRTLP